MLRLSLVPRLICDERTDLLLEAYGQVFSGVRGLSFCVLLKGTLDINITPVKENSAVDPIGFSFPDPCRVSTMPIENHWGRDV